jgi:AAA domain
MVHSFPQDSHSHVDYTPTYANSLSQEIDNSRYDKKSLSPAPDAEDAPEALWEPLALLLDDADDFFVCGQLPEYIRTYPHAPSATIVEHPQVLARLCAMGDTPFIHTVLALAVPHPAVLFLVPVMERIAALAYHQYKAEFMRGVRGLPGFDARAYDRYELHPYRLRHSAQEGCRQTWTIYTAAELLAMEFPPLQWVVDSILPAGLTLFSGRGKDGKSMLVWNLCLAVASGGLALGRYGVLQGDVLYLDLEDGGRRAQERLKHVMQGLPEDGPRPTSLEIVPMDAAIVGQGLEGQLTGWLDQHPNARLIAIDILEKIRPQRQRGGSVYADDYAALASLQRLAQERNVAIIVVHHSNKSKYEDFRDSASGSMGLIGVCDSFWGLSRVAGKPDAVLKITGREVEEQELALQFAEGFWNVTGEAEDLRRSQAALTILDALRLAGGMQTVKELCASLGTPENVIRVRLCRMQQRGEIQALGEGRYAVLTWTPTPTPGGITYGVPREAPPVIPVMVEAEPLAPKPDTPAQEVPPVEPPAAAEGITPLTGQAHDTRSATNGHSNGQTPRQTAAMVIPCSSCGHQTPERWDDHGTLRCVTCWPPPLLRR